MKNINMSKIQKAFIFIGILLFMFGLLASELTDGDTLFHIKLGEYIIHNGLPHKDMFSIHEGLDYTAYAFGFEILLYYIYNIAGFTGIVIFRYLWMLLFILLFTYVIHKLNNKNTWFKSLIGSGLGLLSFCAFTAVRPQLISYIMLVFQIYIMNRWAKNKTDEILWLLPVTFLVLNCFHGGVYMFHGGLVAMFGLDLLFSYDGTWHIHNIFTDKQFYKFILIMILSATTIVLNPYFPDIFTYALKTIGDKTMMQVTEWAPSNLMSLLLTMILFIASFKYVRIKKIPIGNIICLAICFYLTATSYRFSPYLSIFTIFLFTYTEFPNFKIIESTDSKLKTNSDRNLVAISIFLFCAVFCSISYLSNYKTYTFSFDDDRFPVKAVEYIKKENITGRIYNGYNYGAYLLFNDIKVFIDPRCDLYSSSYNPGTEVLNDVFNSEKNISIYDIAQKYNLKYALLNKNDRNIKLWVLKQTDLYTTLYEDDDFILIQFITKLNYKS